MWGLPRIMFGLGSGRSKTAGASNESRAESQPATMAASVGFTPGGMRTFRWLLQSFADASP